MVIHGEDASILLLQFAALEHSFKKFKILIYIYVFLHLNANRLTIEMVLMLLFIGILIVTKLRQTVMFAQVHMRK